MTVSPCTADFLICNKELYNFLLAAQQYCLENNCQRIANISLAIDPVDPLTIFANLASVNQINFYWQNPSQKEAIAAIDSIEKLEFTGEERFKESEEFINQCRKKILCFPRDNSSQSSPVFFCSFGFFDRNINQNYPFAEANIFLPRWQISYNHGKCTLIANIIINARADIHKIIQKIWVKIQEITNLKYSGEINILDSNKYIKKAVTSPSKFKLSVLSALNTINSNYLNKIVLANALDVISNNNFDLFQSLKNLRYLHPNCYIFSTSNGRGQNFIGASPERLISIRKQQLITDALAGSAPRGQTPAEDAASADRLISSQKERHEHSLVIDFITQSLSELGLSPEILKPRLRRLSNIQHLWTPIQATIPQNVHPLQIVAQLHPTPAVAGTAPDLACKEIRRYENFERGLYAAPLGWIDLLGNSDFVVGIRSALIDGERARLYAGAGIVSGSDPDKEIAEIQLKLQALLKALV
ncbi:isochorismate synthase [Mastigocoleus testarum]|uniref:isochorismate synthase n=1 Tax=Mastigocoleus testarum BC008 TaxID=371196 RepID=A0A0V7ZRQ8_9CYAN|nr:isochorismate synthase [Mastigocoleus testarum]KST67089.1 isochorismate synthase [Mastigocoleus testarum BC008]